MRTRKKNSGLAAEFKQFILRGNVIDLAVGVIVGAAFSSITTSLVQDVFMPFVGLFLGGVDFSTWTITFQPLFAGGTPAVINIGLFIQSIVDFLILALIVFFIVRGINKLHRKKEEAVPLAPPAPSAEVLLLTEIRDLLAAEPAQKP